MLESTALQDSPQIGAACASASDMADLAQFYDIG